MDRATIEESAQAVLTSDVVADRIEGWLGDGLAAAAELGGAEVDAALREVATTPAVNAALDQIIEGLVDAALATPGTVTEIDLGGALAPLVPPVVAELEAAGIAVPEDRVASAFEYAATVVLTTEQSEGISGAASQARSLLTTVLVAGFAALLLFGSLAIALAEERMAMVRSLAIRLAVSGATFVLFLRLSAWATDPARGRSPLVAGGSVLLASNHLVLVSVTAAALAVALVAGFAVRRRCNTTGGSPLTDSDASPAPALVTVG